MYVCKYVRVCARAHVCMWVCLCACVCVWSNTHSAYFTGMFVECITIQHKTHTSTINATLRFVRLTTVAAENNRYYSYIFWEFVCSLRHSSYNGQAPYNHLWSVRLSLQLFTSLTHIWHDFRKTVIEPEIFYEFFWNISYSKKNCVKYYHKCTLP